MRETIAVPVELVREMSRPVAGLAGGGPVLLSGTVPGDLRRLIEALPVPPKPDPVEECIRAFEAGRGNMRSGGSVTKACMRAALRRYREVKGMDRDPELDEP